MKKIARTIVLIVTILAMSFTVGCLGGTKDEKPELVGTPTMSVEYRSYSEYYSVEIKGTIKNTTTKAYDWVDIEFVLYDADGNNLGTASDTIFNLLAGDTWNFTATDMFLDGEPCSFQLIEISAH